MILIDPSVEYLPQAPGIEGIYKHIEAVARTCYKSEDKITETSAEPFVNRLMKSQHYAMLEHGTVYLTVPRDYDKDFFAFVKYSPYTMVTYRKDDANVYITTNLRVLAEHKAMYLLDKFLCEPTEYHTKRITLKFITDIGVSREGNRHRRFSIAEMSTRYCNYSKDKFGGELTFIKPTWYSQVDSDIASYHFRDALQFAEDQYLNLIKLGWKPQQAREVLPLSTATEVVYTAFEDDWRHFFDLRYRGTTGVPHPNMQKVATLAHDVILKELGKDL